MRFFRLAAAMFLLAACATVTQAFARQAVAAPSTATSPEAVTRSFYQWYLRTLNDDQDPFKKKAEMSKYVTQRLIRQLTKMINSPDGIDADYFLNAQDFDESWAKNMTLSKPVIQKAAATLNVTFKWGDSLIKTRVTLKQENNSWKIDKVQGL